MCEDAMAKREDAKAKELRNFALSPSYLTIAPSHSQLRTFALATSLSHIFALKAKLRRSKLPMGRP